MKDLYKRIETEEEQTEKQRQINQEKEHEILFNNFKTGKIKLETPEHLKNKPDFF
jgi:hypothetical protein